jgi:aspartyl aminopeptidase
LGRHQTITDNEKLRTSRETMYNTELNKGLLEFLNSSPTPFHAVVSMVKVLEAHNFTKLNEKELWKLASGNGYYVVRNDSSIIVFRYYPEKMQQQGLAMLGAHTDSPCLKVKPNPEIDSNGYFQLGVETYGGALLAPWFDRDLSIAGRVVYVNNDDEITSTLIDFKKAIAIIPSLAIHLNREANTANHINKQTHLPPILMQTDSSQKTSLRELLKKELADNGSGDCKKILDYELSFYGTEQAAIIGLKDEFIASARLDNLLSCYLGLQAIIKADSDPVLLVCNDHEEVGSSSACGAQGPMLEQCLQRMMPNTEDRIRTINRSMMISIDNAHGIHPNYAEMHDDCHGPLLNNGPVIKTNANQRYATNSETSSLFKHACSLAQVPVQEFVTRSDLGCGSTIGPITSTEIGVKTLDIGLPTFAMHSIRELAGAKDTLYLLKALDIFLTKSQKTIDML